METTAIVFSDSPIVSAAFERCLSLSSSFVRCRSCSRLDDLIQTAALLKPELILIDFDAVQFSFVVELHRIVPATAIVLWVREMSAELAYGAIHAGVRGILPRRLDGAAMAESVSRVARGELWLDRTMSTQLLTLTPVRLSKRESELLTLIAQGLKNKEIATALDLSEGTIRIYLSHLYQKIGAKDRYELALFALRQLGLGRGGESERKGAHSVDSQQVVFRRGIA